MTDIDLVERVIEWNLWGIARTRRKPVLLADDVSLGIIIEAKNPLREASGRHGRYANRFTVPCDCHPGPVLAIDEPPAPPPRRHHVVMHFNLFVEGVRTWIVWLGQCPDCRAIWWKVVR